MKKYIFNYLFTSLILAFNSCSIGPPKTDMQFPKYYRSVNDFENVIDIKTEDSLNKLLETIGKEKGIYVAVTTLNFNSQIGSDSFSNYTLKLARKWKIGSEKGRGVLIAFSTSQRLWRVQLTSDISELVAPNEISALFNDNIKNNFKSMNFSEGIRDFTTANIDLILRKADQFK